MKILINEKNADKINAAIKEAEGRASVRTVTFTEVMKSVKHIEMTLGIPKTKMVGIIADVDYHAQNFPNAYKYTPESTHFCMERKNSGWVLIHVSRETTRRMTQGYRLTLTETAKAAIIESMKEFE